MTTDINFMNLTPSNIEGICNCGCGLKTSGRPYRRGHNKRTAIKYIVDSATGCWVWQSHTDSHGYAQARMSGDGSYKGGVKGQGRKVLVHRFLWQQINGFLPPTIPLDHLCRNRRCVNPKHLEPVTHTENIRRGASVKLSVALVKEMRAKKAAGARNVDLAREYKLSRSQTWKVLNGWNWGDV